jgi:hypothetical protein
MRTITLEEHHATFAVMDGPGRQIKEQAEAAKAHAEVAAGLARLIDQLCDILDYKFLWPILSAPKRSRFRSICSDTDFAGGGQEQNLGQPYPNAGN